MRPRPAGLEPLRCRRAPASGRIPTALVGAVLVAATGVLPIVARGATVSFTATQVQRGQAAYDAKCAMCHGAALEGRDAPALTGVAFAQKFGTAARLHAYLSATMPPFAPGQIGEQAYLDIVAYILSVNGVQPGKGALTAAGLTEFDLTGLVPATLHDTTPAVTSGVVAEAAVPQAFTWGRKLPNLNSAPRDAGTPKQPVMTVIPERIDSAAEAVGAVRSRRSYAPVTNAMVLDPPAEEWLMWRRTLDSQGYSPLDQVNRKNVRNLELAWAWPMAETGQQQTAPLVHDGIMFIATTDDVVQALDAATGDLIWEYRHALSELPVSWGYQRYQARRQKGPIALYQDKVILATADAKLVALDAATGQIAWQVQAFDYTRGYSYTVGPLVVNGKIISGISGCSIAGTAGGCFIAVHDVNTGKELWRFNILDDTQNPDQQSSWGGVPPGNRWGGSSWATGSYDPRTNTIFWGTGNPGPYSELIRGSRDGAVLYTNSTLALDADTGKLKWYYQHLPRDNWDMDSPFERVLLDRKIDGKLRHLVVSVAGKNGIAFALDRDTGEFIWARETIVQNVVTTVDKNGTVHINEKLIPGALGDEKFICPSVWGGKSWQAGTYSPLTGLFYVPLAESCNTQAPVRGIFTAGNYVGSITAGPRVFPPGVSEVGVTDAVGIPDGRRKWRHSQRALVSSSLLATGGGLLFGGDAGRHFKAFDQETGRVLWQVRLNAPIAGHPMTYGINGVQYLAVPTGYSAQAGSAASLFPEIPLPSGAGNSLFVFRLRTAVKH